MTDPENDLITVTITSGPSFVILSGETLVINPTVPADFGGFKITVQIVDIFGNFATP